MTSTRHINLWSLLANIILASQPVFGWLFGEEGFGGYGDPFRGRAGPYDANTTEFEAAVAVSNATGVFRIPGYDVSKPWPGQPMDGWTISLAMLDFPSTERWCSNGDCRGNGLVGDSITIQAPDALLKEGEQEETKIVNAHPSWGMCAWIFHAPSQLHPERFNNIENRPLADDGSCVGLLSDECIAALKQGTRYSYLVASSPEEAWTRFPDQVTMCRKLTAPKECGKKGPGNNPSGVPTYGGIPVPYLNGSVTTSDGWFYDGDDMFNSTQDLRDFWDAQVLNYRVIVTAMVNATIDANATDKDRGDPLAQVFCVAPNGAGTGKGFTFNRTVPANARNFQGGVGGNRGEDGKENGAVSVISQGKGGLWVLLLVLLGVSVS
ncbi:hypothetical protein VTJ04DRAFT_1938 [Mycothermus thermophilus]|uniref:uncharacterized protein n=1 Tax=Humicola insolens TaxID=85995 RepID=UPI003743B22F